MAGPTAAGRKDGSDQLFASARLFLLLQLASRLGTFALNQFLIRITSPDVFGATTIQFELLMGLILTAAREGVRCVILREGNRIQSARTTENGQCVPSTVLLPPNEQVAHNLSFVAVAIGALFDVSLSFFYIRHASSTLRSSPHFAPTVTLFAVGGILELLSEPLFNRAQVLGNVQLRVRAEGLAILANCATILACMVKPEWFGVGRHLGSTYGLMAYGWGRLSFGLVILLCYVYAFHRSIGARRTRALLWPRKAIVHGQSRYLSPKGISISWAMGKQAMLKHVMGESDKIAVARLGTLEDQGGYALASNYGSLILRILFNPVEEASRITFSKTLGHILSAQDGSVMSLSVDDENALQSASSMLAGILRLHILLGLFFATFGPPLSRSAIYLLAGDRWACGTTAPIILGAYACYIPVLGINGIAEGFLTATAGPRQLGTYNWIIMLSSATFIMSLWLLQWVPALHQTALVWSSALSIGVRAAYSWWYMLWFFSLQPSAKHAANMAPTAILPSTPSLITFAVSAYLLRAALASARVGGSCPVNVRQVVPSIGIGAFFTLACLFACFTFERRKLSVALSAVRSRGKSKAS
ncbi:Rft-1-domain-containing protein [Tilletiaria anomala UBC 951]|uniref:Man(5)GlcNAc(2)-PP-dolichol translocation protein RFT1 n=1 Tax=Tilletiaria anomala (strain ATCC 24038 / CBS 436.72 / UBC 951) TaxID=1037660 RepID=A0A066VKG4_TILAU|nr:Rft-1-domain-containing protein [Tilletiaria anomala UBC 951]KDN39249.1 Rft-1-domain-containing protein [Tilletiaria anomala UBC 951]